MILVYYKTMITKFKMTDDEAANAITNHLQVFDTYPTISPTLPWNTINNMLQHVSTNTYYQDVMSVSGYVDLFPIRKLYITPQTLGT